MLKHNKCRMVSIDSSTNKTAYAVYEGGSLTGHGLLDISDEHNMDNRFSKMSRKIMEILSKYDPDIVYIEETVVIRNAQTQRFLTRLQGVVYAWTILNNCDFNTIRPTQWRKLVGIDQTKKKREVLKAEAIELVKTLFELECNDDEAEAILIGLAAIRMYNPKTDVMKEEIA